MRRLLWTMATDVRLQARNGFYCASAFIAVVSIIVLRQLPTARLGYWIPIFVLSNLTMNTFYFVAGLVLLEKGEGTLWAQIVTPLRHGEYLASKAATLTVLSLLESLAIVVAGYGTRISWIPLTAGLTLASVVYVLSGFIAVSRFDSINEYLFPSTLITLVFAPPFLGYFGIWNSPLLYLHPLQGPLLLTGAAFKPIEPRQWLYALLSSALSIAWLFRWSRSAFAKFIVAAPGVH